MGTPHMHADLIKAWADGAEIELKSSVGWQLAPCPQWWGDRQYRVKPVPHKWQHLIDAQAAGKACQMFSGGKWSNGPWTFDSTINEYRLKPEPVVLKTKRFWWVPQFGAGGRTCLSIVTEADQKKEPRERWQGFVSWIDTEWQEHKVPA